MDRRCGRAMPPHTGAILLWRRALCERELSRLRTRARCPPLRSAPTKHYLRRLCVSPVYLSPVDDGYNSQGRVDLSLILIYPIG